MLPKNHWMMKIIIVGLGKKNVCSRLYFSSLSWLDLPFKFVDFWEAHFCLMQRQRVIWNGTAKFFVRARVCDSQLLIRSLAVTHCHLHIHTHTKTLLNQDSEMTHTFILCTGICILLLGEGEPILASWLCAHIPSFPSSLSACLPPLLFVTNQPTFFSYIFRALFHALHDPPSTVSSPLVHILVTLVLLSSYYAHSK